MATKYFLAPNARWQGRDQTGNPCVGGKLYTYAAGSLIPKATYQDPFGTNPNTNPVLLDGKGEANIYWANDNLYYIELYDANSNLVYSQDNYPDVDFEGTVNNFVLPVINMARNPQFSFWGKGSDFTNFTVSSNKYDYIADDWILARNNLNATLEIKKIDFTLGQTTVPNNPQSYLEYICSNTGAGGETTKYIGQYYDGVQSLANQTVTVSFWAKSSSNSSISAVLTQYFGTGGSPSGDQDNLVLTANLTSTWAQYSGTVTMKSITGLSAGTNNDSAVILKLNMPLNQTATVDICNVQLQLGNTVTQFPYQTINDQFKHCDYRVNLGVFQTGDIKMSMRSVADSGWLMCDDTTIGNLNSNATHAGFFAYALFVMLWQNTNVLYCPILNSDGTSGTKGASADADWQANKQMVLTKVLGRALAGAGTGILSKFFTVDPSTDIFSIDNANNVIYNATPVTVSVTGGSLPAPLLAATQYWAVVQSNTTFKLATSQQNAVNGSFINITTAGSGTLKVNLLYNAWNLAQNSGEENHGLTTNEIPSHTHTVPFVSVPNILSSGGGQNLVNPGTTTSSATGGSAIHNNIQPTSYWNVMIKL